MADDPQQQQPVDLDITKLNKSELTEYASETHGLTFDAKTTIKQMLAAIEEAKTGADYEVIHRVRHAGTVYAKGATITLTVHQAAPLLATGYIEQA